MQISCPQCKTRFNFDEARVGDQGIKLRCSRCHVVFKVVKRVASPSSADTSARQPAGTPRIKVFVANESQPFCAAVRKLLGTEPFDVTSYNDGRSTMAAIEAEKPSLVLLDVALPAMYGFEICEAVRSNPDLSSVKLVLIASVYDKTRYKRTPGSLYGADAYIEKHHIPDALVPLIYRLLAGESPDAGVSPELPKQQEGKSASVDEAREQDTARELIRRDEEQATTAPPELSPDQHEAHVKARRLARIIVSDILLYNQEKVEQGVRNGTFYDLVADDIREGRSLYMKRVPQEIYSRTSYLDEAFEHLIARKRAEMNLG